MEADKFRDAEEEDVRHSGDYDMGKDLLGFHPPPPRNHGYDPLSSPYRPSEYTSSPTRPPLSNGLGSSGYSASSPGRERMPSSNSITSMSSNTGGRRAPAPAALELSPRKERPYTRNPYEGLGHGVPASETRRVATEPILDRVSLLYLGAVILADVQMPSGRDLRPLPQPPLPPGASANTLDQPYESRPPDVPSRSYLRQSTQPLGLSDPSRARTTSTSAMPLSIPLSAVGERHRITSSSSGQDLQPAQQSRGPS